MKVFFSSRNGRNLIKRKIHSEKYRTFLEIVASAEKINEITQSADYAPYMM